MVHATISTTPITHDMLTRFPWTTIDQDWFGKPVPAAPAYRLVIDCSTIWFSGKRNHPAVFDEKNKNGTFVEGLWEKELAELFLCEPGTTRYQEFNLAPGGAWWSCLFDSYRQRAPQSFRSFSNVKTFSTVSDKSWEATIAIPKAELSIKCDDAKSLRANVTFILLKPQQQFVTATKLTAKEPDFHVTEQFSLLR